MNRLEGSIIDCSEQFVQQGLEAKDVHGKVCDAVGGVVHVTGMDHG